MLFNIKSFLYQDTVGTSHVLTFGILSGNGDNDVTKKRPIFWPRLATVIL